MYERDINNVAASINLELRSTRLFVTCYPTENPNVGRLVLWARDNEDVQSIWEIIETEGIRTLYYFGRHLLRYHIRQFRLASNREDDENQS